MRLTFTAGLAAIAFAATGGVARAESAADFNLFVLENLAIQGSDTEGRVAVGGNATLTPYSVGAVLGGGTNLVVRGNVTGEAGSVKGAIVAGGNVSLNQIGDITRIDAGGNVRVTNGSNFGDIRAGGTVTTSAMGYNAGATGLGNQPFIGLPVNFTAEGARLTALSTKLAGQTQTGTVASYDGGGTHGLQLTLTGNAAGLNVFNIAGSALTATNTLTINLTTPGALALINVSGTVGKFYEAGISINGGSNSSVLYNFADATSLNFYGIDVRGSVLAPRADYLTTGYGVINGQVIVKSFKGSYSGGATQVNNVRFAGSTLSEDPFGAAVPEPAMWAQMVLGFGILGMIIRRRRNGAFA